MNQLLPVAQDHGMSQRLEIGQRAGQGRAGLDETLPWQLPTGAELELAGGVVEQIQSRRLAADRPAAPPRKTDLRAGPPIGAASSARSDDPHGGG